VLGFALGAVLFAAAGVLRFFLGGLSEGFGPLTFLPAILVAGVFGGIRVGLVVFGICLLVAWVWFFPPYGTFALAPRDVITMVIFIVTAGLELYVVRNLNLAISDLARARERSNTLFRELQHRVANNLQLVAALLHLRRGTVDDHSAGAHALDAARSRLDLMSRVHRRLHDPAAVDLPLGRYLRDLCKDLIESSAVPYVRLQVEAAPVHLELESFMSLSLIVAELVTNSLKHAFQGRTEGNIAIKLIADEAIYTLTVADDGCGLPKGPSNAKLGGSLGQGILQSLAAQLHGAISFESRKGTTARLVFPGSASASY
jgi:two-component sensor histidine kinase